MNGRLPAVPSTAQNSVTMRNPSRVPSSVRARNVSSHMKKTYGKHRKKRFDKGRHHPVAIEKGDENRRQVTDRAKQHEQ